MWIRESPDCAILTIGESTHIADPRYSVKFKYPNNWRLEISSIQKEDRGVYVCQVNTHPPRVLVTNVTILGKLSVAKWEGDGDDRSGCECGWRMIFLFEAFFFQKLRNWDSWIIRENQEYFLKYFIETNIGGNNMIKCLIKMEKALIGLSISCKGSYFILYGK